MTATEQTWLVICALGGSAIVGVFYVGIALFVRRKNRVVSMGRTLQMFERPKVPRVVRMHVIDAGVNDCAGDPIVVQYRCSRCNYESEWMTARTDTEVKRGIPCPNCNHE